MSQGTPQPNSANQANPANSANSIDEIDTSDESKNKISVNIILSILFGFSGLIFFLLFFDSHYKTLHETNLSKMKASEAADNLQLFLSKSLKK